MLDLTGKVALVPGASGGIGAAVAEVLAEAGAAVALGYRSNQQEAAEVLTHCEAHSKARLDQVDTSDYDAVKRWVATVTKELGPIDIAATCVGWRPDEGFTLFADQTPEHWRTTIDVQLMSHVHVCHAVVPQMVERKSGRIMAVGSDAAKVGESGAVVSAAAHGGLLALTKSLAREVGRHGVTVNLVCPGPTEGPTLEALKAEGGIGEKIVAEMIRRIPMKRPGTKREVANVFAFLASDEAAYITGQAISVSGGLTMN